MDSSTDKMPVPESWLGLALQPSVFRRALKTALLVGAMLILINHWDALLTGDLDAGRLLKMGLTVMVPYLVSTSSSVGALRQQGKAEDT